MPDTSSSKAAESPIFAILLLVGVLTYCIVDIIGLLRMDPVNQKKVIALSVAAICFTTLILALLRGHLRSGKKSSD